MNWRNLKTNYPADDCMILCRIDHQTYTETYTALWFGRGRNTFCEATKYGLHVPGTTRSVIDANDKLMYIVIDDIK